MTLGLARFTDECNAWHVEVPLTTFIGIVSSYLRLRHGYLAIFYVNIGRVKRV